MSNFFRGGFTKITVAIISRDVYDFWLTNMDPSTSALEQQLSNTLAGEVRFDPYSKALYSTDASLYQIEPIGVVIPKDSQDVIKTVQIAAERNIPILPRGGGTSLAGQSVVRRSCWTCPNT